MRPSFSRVAAVKVDVVCAGLRLFGGGPDDDLPVACLKRRGDRLARGVDLLTNDDHPACLRIGLPRTCVCRRRGSVAPVLKFLEFLLRLIKFRISRFQALLYIFP